MTRTALFVAIVCATRVAAAEPPEARAAKDAAYKAFELSDYDTAIDNYKKAYKLTEDPRLFYNLGLSYRKRADLAGHRADLVEARDYFHRFMTLADPALPAFRGDRARLDKMRALARTYLDDIDRELAKPEPPPQTASPPPVAPKPLPPPEPAHRGTGKLLLVGAGVLVAAGGVTGALALANDSDAREAKKLGDVAATNAAGDRARSYALATDVLIGSAVVAGGIGLYLALHREHPPEQPKVGVALSSSSAAVVVRF